LVPNACGDGFDLCFYICFADGTPNTSLQMIVVAEVAGKGDARNIQEVEIYGPKQSRKRRPDDNEQ
jgi:ribosomal protein S16